MTKDEIKELVDKIYEDHVLSRSEKKALVRSVEGMKSKRFKLDFLVNYAFKTVEESSINGKISKGEAFRWLRNFVTVIMDSLEKDAPHMVDSHFGAECKTKLIELISGARHTIDVCVYTITDREITAALEKARRSKVKVRIISDHEKVDAKSSHIRKMAKNGIFVKVDTDDQLMHNKFAIFDEKLVLTGSFNWTYTASTKNYENIVITNRDVAVSAFQNEFDSLWETLSWLEK